MLPVTTKTLLQQVSWRSCYLNFICQTVSHSRLDSESDCHCVTHSSQVTVSHSDRHSVSQWVTECVTVSVSVTVRQRHRVLELAPGWRHAPLFHPVTLTLTPTVLGCCSSGALSSVPLSNTDWNNTTVGTGSDTDTKRSWWGLGSA